MPGYEGNPPRGQVTANSSPSSTVVFQSFALFDELSPAENIEIAIEHSSEAGVSASSNQTARDLLKELAGS